MLVGQSCPSPRLGLARLLKIQLIVGSFSKLLHKKDRASFGADRKKGKLATTYRVQPRLVANKSTNQARPHLLTAPFVDVTITLEATASGGESACGEECDYCWYGSEYEHSCSANWLGTDDGCDCGCQQVDPDCDSIDTSSSFPDFSTAPPLDTIMALYGPFEGVVNPGPQIVQHLDGETVAAPPILFEVTEDAQYLIAFASWQEPGMGFYRLSLGCDGTDYQCMRTDYCVETCEDIEHGIAVCRDGTCDFECDEGYHRSLDRCVPTLDCVPGVIGDPIQVTDSRSTSFHSIAHAGDNIAVFWIERTSSLPPQEGIFWQLYDATTMLRIDEPQRIVRVEPYSGFMNSVGGGRFGVGYVDSDAERRSSDCNVRFYSPSGALTSWATDVERDDNCWEVSLAMSDPGSNYAVAYWNYDGVGYREFDHEGRVLGYGSINPDGHLGTGRTIAWHPDSSLYVVAYTAPPESSQYESEVYTAALGPSGSTIAVDQRITSTEGGAGSPNIVTSESGFGLTYYDGRSDRSFFQQLDSRGLAETTAREIAVGMSTDLAYSGYEFAVVWEHHQGVFVSILDDTGSNVSEPIEVATPSTASSVAWSGDSFLVAYENLNDDQGVYLSRVCPER